MKKDRIEKLNKTTLANIANSFLQWKIGPLLESTAVIRLRIKKLRESIYTVQIIIPGAGLNGDSFDEVMISGVSDLDTLISILNEYCTTHELELQLDLKGD